LKLKNNLYQDVLAKFDAGLASEACTIILEESKAMAESGQDSDMTRSDELARLAIKLHWWGDDPNRQKYRKELLEYQTIEKKIVDAEKELLGILQHYVDIFQRFTTITDTSKEAIRLWWSPFERAVRGHEEGFSSSAEVGQYLLGPVRNDLSDFISYTTSFSNSLVVALKRRLIHPGKYHAYAQILLELERAEEKFQRIEKIQHELSSLLAKRQYGPSRPWVTDAEANVRGEIEEVLKNS
jgi:hypothetical protein